MRFLERRRHFQMATSTARILAKEEKMLTAVAESVGSTLGSIAAGVNRVTKATRDMLPKPAARRRVVKRARKTLGKAKKSATKLATKARRKTSATARKAVRKTRKLRRSISR
jgi:hypothetical protein